MIGILVAITFALFLLARYVGGQTQEAWTLIDDNYQEQIQDRISPVGMVAVEGQALPDTGEPPAPEALPTSGPGSRWP